MQLLSSKSSSRMTMLLLALVVLPLNSYSEVIERISAIVNDEIITLSDQRTYRERLKAGRLVDDLLIDSDKTKDAVLKDDQKLLELMVAERLIDSEVKKQNLNVTIEKVEQEIRQISARNKLTRAQLKEALAGQGIKFSEYQDFVKKRLERQALIEKTVTSKIKITDEDINSHFSSTRGQQRGSVYEYTLAQILFQKDKPGAKTRAEEIAKQLKGSPNSFDEIATKYSDDRNFSSGGVLGTFKEGELSKEFQAALTDLQVGQTTMVIKTDAGYHILRILDRKLVANPEMDQEREKIRNTLYQEAFKKQFRFWLDQKKRNAFVRINTA